MITRISTLIFLFLYTNLPAQLFPGARQVSLANSDVALSDDAFSVFNNPAGLAQLNWRELGVYYSPAPFGLKELANGFISYLEPTNYGNFALGIMTYGFELYKENKISLSYANKFQNKFFIGASINVNMLSIKNYGSDKTFSFNVGGLAYILQNLRWGFTLKNIFRSSYGEEKDQIPIVFNTGFSYSFLDKGNLNAAFEKNDIHKASLKFGLEYSLVKYLVLRSGISTEPSNFTAGLGIIFSIVELDYAVMNHQDLGLTHQAGLLINLSGNDDLRTARIKNFLFNSDDYPK